MIKKGFLFIVMSLSMYAEDSFIAPPIQAIQKNQNTKADLMEKTSILPQYFSKTLSNGLEVVVVPIKNGSGVIESNVFYKVGSRNEVMGKSGIAHMLEHLNFKSTKNLKAGEFDEIVKKFGGLTNASTSFDYTRYFVKSSVQNLDKSLELFAEMLQNLKLDDAEFQPERNVVAEERRWRTDNSPIGYLYFRFFNTAYIYHPYHWTPIGFLDDIKNWKIEDIREFHSTYYQPKNAIILVSGDVDPQAVFLSAQKHFEHIENKKANIPDVYTVEPKQDGARHIEIKKDTQIEYFALGYKIPDFKNKDQVALSVLAELLSGGRSSILQEELVDHQRLASEVYAYPMDLRDEGVFLLILGGNKEVKAESMRDALLKIIDEIKGGKITQAMLEKAKINIKSSFIYSLEDASSVASLFGDYLARGDIQPLLEYEKNLQSLSVDDLVNVAKKYFTSESCTSVILRR